MLYAQVDFPDAALSFTFIFSHCCVFAARPPRPHWLLGPLGAWSGERSQETVWPPSVNYVFTARPGSHWACSAQYVSPATDDKGSDVSVDRLL